MKKTPSAEFAERVRAVRKNLPSRYMSLLDYEFPKKFSTSKVYNVMNAGLEDLEVLEALEQIAQKYESSKV